MNRYATADAMFLGMLKECFVHGPVQSRNGEMLESPGYTCQLLDPRARRVTNKVRNVRNGYPQASVAWNLAEKNDVDSICWWNPNGRRISDDGLTFYGANYGQRWSPYLDEALFLIQTQPETRRAWVPIWMPDDLIDDMGTYSRKGKDVPCTIGFGLSIRHEALHMHVVMRSQAVWGVFPYDVYLLSVLQELIANHVAKDLGTLTWTCLSMHVFERELAFITDALASAGPASLAGQDNPITLDLNAAKVHYPHVLQMAMSGHEIDTYGLGLSDDPVVQGMIQGAAQIRSLAEDNGA